MWCKEDILRRLKEFSKTKEFFKARFNLKINFANEKRFWKAIRRLLIIDYTNKKYFGSVGFKVSQAQLTRLSDDKFIEKVLSFQFITIEKKEKEKLKEVIRTDEIMEIIQILVKFS
ncbi:MAG: hypothetical protein U9Q73_02280 [Nanoarchaeota archaeon]|nr:hypothetical protein [Nanoarchaeota archaeon]